MSPSLLFRLSRQDYVDRYAGSVLGWFWAILWPLVMVFIYVIIFGAVMGVRLPGTDSSFSYGLYLAAGIIPWLAFANSATRATTVWIEKKDIVTKISMSLPMMPLFVLISETFTFLVTLTVFTASLVFLDILPTTAWLFLPVVYLLQELFAYAIGLFFGIFNVFLRDIQEFVNVVFTLWFWGTPIVYSLEIVPEYFQALQEYNPAFMFVDAYREILLHGNAPNFDKLVTLALIAHGLLLAGYLFFKYLERDIRDFL